MKNFNQYLSEESTEIIDGVKMIGSIIEFNNPFFKDLRKLYKKFKLTNGNHYIKIDENDNIKFSWVDGIYNIVWDPKTTILSDKDFTPIAKSKSNKVILKAIEKIAKEDMKK